MAHPERKNSFDIIRFIAASMVVLSHSYALVGLVEPRVGNISLGGFSVWVFFILSGYLISLSWKLYPRFNVFLAKRILRIFPGLVVAIVVTIITMGFVSTVPYTLYIRSGGTLSYLNNILLLNTQYSLPGVFTNNIYPGAVNGSLWTLAFEFVMYICVAVFGAMSLLKKVRITWIWAFFFTANALAVLYPKAMTFSIFYLDMRLIAQMGLMFFSGVFLQIYSSSIRYKPTWWITSLIAFLILITLAPTYTSIFASILLAYGVLGFGHLPYFSSFGKYGDFSYGLYVYSFPVQQLVWYFTQTLSPFKMFGASFGISLILGILSWYFVESRFIKFKKHIKQADYPMNSKHTELSHAW
jgi:peptidoglycan/LPS O-acetylase OafA/YrhL